MRFEYRTWDYLMQQGPPKLLNKHGFFDNAGQCGTIKKRTPSPPRQRFKTAKYVPNKPRKLADSEGLFLLVNPNGSKLWRLKYRVDGRPPDAALQW